MIIDDFVRYIDDGFSMWNSNLNLDSFKTIMNNLHPSIKFTFELGENTTLDDGANVKQLNFFEISILLHGDGTKRQRD